MAENLQNTERVALLHERVASEKEFLLDTIGCMSALCDGHEEPYDEGRTCPVCQRIIENDALLSRTRTSSTSTGGKIHYGPYRRRPARK